MATIGVDPATGRLTLNGEVLDAQDPRMWGSVGRNVLDVSTARPGRYNPSDYDPRFYEPFQYDAGDSQIETGYRLKPEYQNIGTQLTQSGVGGYSEVKDPSRLRWDDQFGILTDQDNIGKPDDGGLTGWLGNGGLLGILAGGALGAIGQAGGFSGMFGGAGLGTDVAPGYLAESVAPQVTEVMAGSPFGSSFLESAMGYLRNNPMSAARGALGLAGAFGGSSPSPGGVASYSGPGGPAPSFNPLSAAGQFSPNQAAYQPMQFDPVPFMEGSNMNAYNPNQSQWGGLYQGQMGQNQRNPFGGAFNQSALQFNMPQGMGYGGASPSTLPTGQYAAGRSPMNQQMPMGMGYGGTSPVGMPGYGQTGQRPMYNQAFSPQMPMGMGFSGATMQAPYGMGYGQMPQMQPPMAPQTQQGLLGSAAPPSQGSSYAGPPPGLQFSGPANSATGAARNAVMDYSSPDYLAYYNSLAPSTRAFMHKPGSAQTAQYLGNEAMGNWEAFNGTGVDPFDYALGKRG